MPTKQEPIIQVLLRNQFYRDNYRRIVLAIMILFFINVVLATSIWYIYTHPKPPQYFPATSDGRILELPPLTVPSQSLAEVLQWANQAALSAYTYDFVNYRKQLQEASRYFTAKGWKQFLVNLGKSNTLTAVRSRKLVVTAEATGAPELINKGVVQQRFEGSTEKRYAWKIKIPILVSYQSTVTNIKQPMTLFMTIIRVRPNNNSRGVGIAQFVAAAGSDRSPLK